MSQNGNFNSSGNNPMYSPEVQRENALSSIRISEFTAKQNIRSQSQEVSHEKRLLRNEEERERRKTQTEVIEVSSQGELTIKTQNLMVEAGARKLANFHNPYVMHFINLDNREKKLFLFCCTVNNEERNIFLLPAKCGSGTYLLRALGSIGCEIYAPSLAEQKKYAQQMFAALINGDRQKNVMFPKTGAGMLMKWEKSGFFRDNIHGRRDTKNAWLVYERFYFTDNFNGQFLQVHISADRV